MLKYITFAVQGAMMIERPGLADLLFIRSSFSSQAAALNLTKGLGSAEEGDNANKGGNRQGLEEVPAHIVEVENQLHRDDRAEEDSVRDGSSRESLLKVCDIAANSEPLLRLLATLVHHILIGASSTYTNEERRHGCDNSRCEH